MTAAPKLSPLAGAAERYAGHGWHVFPLIPREKHPLVKNGGGFLSATADPAQVRAWWGRTPTANIGLWPGQSGLTVIDIDGPEGEVTARALGLLAEPTLVCTTGRPEGGRHLYFRRPDFAVSNCNIGKKLDVRGDAGYVILPPSIHPSGTRYRWAGKASEIHELPPRAVEAIKAARARASLGDGEAHGEAVRDLVLAESIVEGGRNNTLTRYAGRLLARGITDDETLMLVSALNATRCKPPLPQSDVNVLVANIASRERTKRVTGGGTTLALERGPSADPPRELPNPDALAVEQVAAAKGLMTRDISGAATWGWADLAHMGGPMLPGDLVVVGSLMGNGKSTLLMSQMEFLASRGIHTLYMPLEVDPEICRLRWAAWKLGLDYTSVIRQEWATLPLGSRETIEGKLDEQIETPFIHFPPPKRITYGALAQWCRWGVEECGVRVVMLDHFHRMEFGGDAQTLRVSVTEVIRKLKDMAREMGVVLLSAAQLNRNADPLDAYLPPGLHRLKESAAIGEEADAVFMLSRRLKGSLSPDDMKRARTGHLSERELAEDNTMAVTCRKHRLDDRARDRTILLHVRNGRIENRAPSWRAS